GAVARGRRRAAPVRRRTGSRAARASARSARTTTGRNARGSRARVLRRRRSAANGAQAGSLLGPPALELERGAAHVGTGWTRTLAVVGYPREVARGWLEPLLRAAGDLDLALHVEPLAPALAADRLRRQRARLESTRRL